MTRPECSVEGCSKRVHGRSWCPMHYRRWRLTGDVGETSSRCAQGNTALDFLLWHGWRIVPSGCWEWEGARHQDGYGKLVYQGTEWLAHRLSYETFVDTLGELHALHRCDNRICINPDHLFSGTNDDNVADMVSKNRHWAGERASTSKLSWEMVDYIRASTESNIVLGKKYQVDPSVISKVRHGHRWKESTR